MTLLRCKTYAMDLLYSNNNRPYRQRASLSQAIVQNLGLELPIYKRSWFMRAKHSPPPLAAQ